MLWPYYAGNGGIPDLPGVWAAPFFSHRRALQIQANGLGKLNYMGLFLYGCELGKEG